VGDQVVNKQLDLTFTIEGLEEYDFKDATRELLYANIVVEGAPLEYNWDRETGIFIQIDATMDNYTQKYLAYDTNIVGNNDSLLIYGIIIAAVIILLLITLIIFKKKK
jgi:hypothetical protein